MFLQDASDLDGTRDSETWIAHFGSHVHPSNLMTVTHFGNFSPLIHPWIVSTPPYRPRSTLGWCQHAQIWPKSTLRWCQLGPIWP